MLEEVGWAERADGFVGLWGGGFDAFDCIDAVDAWDAVLESIGLLSGRSVGVSESRSEVFVEEDGIRLLLRAAGAGGDGRGCIVLARLTLRD